MLHPGVCLERYLICVETAVVFSVSANRFTALRKPLWLFSSLFWPLPEGWMIRVYDTHLYVFSGRTKNLPSVSRRKNGTFVVKKVCFSSKMEATALARAEHLADQKMFTEKVIAVQVPSMLVSMFLGKHRSSADVLDLLIERLTDACCCQTARSSRSPQRSPTSRPRPCKSSNRRR